jgi:glycosyltransferase involved in cell wall biosynthesis
MRKRGLSAYLGIRNGDRLDYCWREAASAILPICDEMIMSDSDSDDGTREAMEEWATREPKIRVVNWPWINPVGAGTWYLGWLNWIREQCSYDMQIFTDADEVLCPKAYPAIIEAVKNQSCLWVHRLNFWRDNRHITNPPDFYVGVNVARVGPSDLEVGSDEARTGDQILEIQRRAKHYDSVRAFHYGFIRPQKPYIDKAKIMHTAVRGIIDPRILQAETTGEEWHRLYFTDVPLIEYNERDHPEVAWKWLRDRGYEAP